MFRNLKNNISIYFWKRRKTKIQRNGRTMSITHTLTEYEDTVYDLRWTIRITDKKKEVLLKRIVEERASKWNIRHTIHKVERYILPKIVQQIEKEHLNS